MAAAGGGDGDEYLVECILEEKEKNGRPLYLVLWKDYHRDEASWEPAENVKGCEALKIWEKRGATGTAGPADRPEHGDDAAARQLKFFSNANWLATGLKVGISKNDDRCVVCMDASPSATGRGYTWSHLSLSSLSRLSLI